MIALLQAFVDIALHRRGPEDLPESRFLLMLVGFVYLAISVLSITSQNGTASKAFLIVALDLLVLTAWFWVVLAICRYRNRFVQALTAVLGTEVVLELIALPLSMTMPEVSGGDSAIGLGGFALIAVLLWNLSIIAHILSHALEASYSTGLSIGFLYLLTTYALLWPLLR